MGGARITKKSAGKGGAKDNYFVRFWHWCKWYWNKNWFHKSIVILALIFGLIAGSTYGVARWYIWTQEGKPLVLGASFIPAYAKQLGVNPRDTLHAMFTELGIKHVRYVSYWSDIEPKQGTYNFKTLDWEFAEANANHAKVTLAIGLRQPRWPECHPPNWVDTTQPYQQWLPQIEQYMQKVIERYKGNPALESYQLENEYFLKVFGECKNYSRERLVAEYNFVKQQDPGHTVIIARSNNNIGWPINAPTPDEYGVSVYKRVWVPLIGRYVEYPFPAWFYAALAGGSELLQGKNMVIHELQAEPWPPHSKNLVDTTIEEQNGSLSPKRLEGRFTYGEATGIKQMDLWGAEFWYYRKVKLNNPDLWNVAKQQYQAASEYNAKLSNKD
ncbi:MAG TPA: beta-galactosidase [Candidatus Saccharimonadales bacterium]|nr:beta-galactosidase [Candidatus Saccharimonadales bacterium]